MTRSGRTASPTTLEEKALESFLMHRGGDEKFSGKRRSEVFLEKRSGENHRGKAPFWSAAPRPYIRPPSMNAPYG
jgi:hypothetical protein